MNEPPAILHGAHVLKYAIVDASVVHTGRITLHVGGEVLGPAAGLAICKYDRDNSFCLFYCNEKWDVLAACGYPSMQMTLEMAEIAYRGVSEKWQSVV
ncbi:MAG: hypothetical protein V1736_04315 [Pseudomonadota bacterium]